MSTVTPKKIGENEYLIEADSNLGMKVPVKIYADAELLQKMLSDRTIMQAKNVATIPGIVGHDGALGVGRQPEPHARGRLTGGLKSAVIRPLT